MEERILVSLDQGSFCEDEFCLGSRVLGRQRSKGRHISWEISPTDIRSRSNP